MRPRKVVLALGVFGLSALLAARLLRREVAPVAWASDYDVSASAPEVVSPGTVVERTAPKGWSHLVIKSLPRVREAEKPRVPSFGRELVIRMAAWMFTVFTADVVREQHGAAVRYRLRAIGLGLGASAGGRDVVVTAKTARQHGVEMNQIKDQIIDTGYKIQGQAVIPVRGPTFALLDTPVVSRCGDRNRMVRYRYALLVDPSTGALDVMLWVLGAEGGACADLTRAVLLEPNCIDEAELVPDPQEFDGLIPSDLSFAVDKLPPYRLEIPIPPELRGPAAGTKFTPDEARALEDGLRELAAKHRR